jgi:O-antigen/teichoic acid export membrane protein
LLLGLGILSVLGTGANPLNQVLLSKISMMLAEDRIQEARQYIQHLFSASVEISCFVCIQVVIFADVAIRIWVGPKYVTDMLLIRILLAAVPFYLLHTALRCVIDAASITAYNTRNILIAFGAFVVLICAVVRTLPEALLLHSIAAIFLLALVVLSWLTAKTLNHLYGVRLSWRDSGPLLLFSGLLGLASFLFRFAQHFNTSSVQAVALEVLLTALFYWFLNQRRSPWLMFMRNAFLQKRVATHGVDAAVVLKSA